ncbi:protein of unknown function (plasmid) [Shinella sp. WSC3-e]|nr:hypothetical protein SHINE37_100143 [Rhizobiaceae bacterium]CAK7261688.1 protein of unknown function [Shinella sp. WSC3-e]
MISFEAGRDAVVSHDFCSLTAVKLRLDLANLSAGGIRRHVSANLTAVKPLRSGHWNTILQNRAPPQDPPC